MDEDRANILAWIFNIPYSSHHKDINERWLDETDNRLFKEDFGDRRALRRYYYCEEFVSWRMLGSEDGVLTGPIYESSWCWKNAYCVGAMSYFAMELKVVDIVVTQIKSD
jgi:hypothetical protein